MESFKTLTLKEVCRQLNITEASGRNWLKLGKLTPDLFDGKRPLFYQNNIDILSLEIVSGKNKALKSRRNKKHIIGNSLYEAYLSADSKNLKSIREIFRLIQEKKKTLKESEILYIVADAGIKMCADAGIKIFGDTEANKISSCPPNASLFAYLKRDPYLKTCLCNGSSVDMSNFEDERSFSQEMDFLHNQGLSFLLRDMIDDSKKASCFILQNRDLFSFEFVYEPEEDVLGMIYLSLKALSVRKSKGIYYTPKSIVQRLLENLKDNTLSECTWLDPCSGSGNFLLQLPENVALKNIYAMDIDQSAIAILRLNLALKYRNFDYNLLKKNCVVCDFLTEPEHISYDVIIGNPPWGYDFSESELQFLKERFGKRAQRGKIESYDLFLEQAIRKSKEGGIVSFVLPEALLNVKSHQNIRAFLLEKMKFKHLEYLGHAFSKVHCPAIILTLEKGKRGSCLGMKVKSKDCSFCIEIDRKLDFSAFNFDVTDDEYNVLMKIQKLEGCRFLKGRSKFALGIVTGNNRSYLSEEKTSGNEQVVKGCDIFKYKVVRAHRYLEFKQEGFQQMAPMEYYRASEKLFYRFICNQPVFAYDDSKSLSLNSCNILIPKLEDMKMKYILSVLNSRIALFYFQKRFNSVKVLRSHIESIPIPILSLKEQEKIILLVDKIMDSTNSNERFELYDKMDIKIAKLFRLSKKDYEIVLSHVRTQSLFLNEG